MKLDRQCIGCLERMVDQIAENTGADSDLGREVLRSGRAMLREKYRPDRPPPWLAAEVSEAIAAMTGQSDLYHRSKGKEMMGAQEVFRSIRPLYGDDFRSAVELAVVGNNLDFFRDSKVLRDALIREGGRPLDFAIDHIRETERLVGSLKNGSVVFLSDNAGEAFFDAPLVKKLASLGLAVVYGVKEKPFLNDLTVADLEPLDMMRQIARIQSTGTGAILDLESLSPAFRRELNACDLIVSKGQANYESLTELPVGQRILYLLKVKCQPLSDTLHVPVNSHVALLLGPGTGSGQSS